MKHVFIDLTGLRPEILEPIQAWVDKYRNTPRFECRFHWVWIDLTIRIPPRGNLIRPSLLKAIFYRHAELARASERASRQQAADLQAQQEHDLAQARTDFLASMTPCDRGLFAAQLAARAEADARVARGYDALLTQTEGLSREVEALRADKKRLEKEIARTNELYRAESECLKAQNKTLAAEKQVLDDVNWWLQEQLRSGGLSRMRHVVPLARIPIR